MYLERILLLRHRVVMQMLCRRVIALVEADDGDVDRLLEIDTPSFDIMCVWSRQLSDLLLALA